MLDVEKLKHMYDSGIELMGQAPLSFALFDRRVLFPRSMVVDPVKRETGQRLTLATLDDMERARSCRSQRRCAGRRASCSHPEDGGVSPAPSIGRAPSSPPPHASGHDSSTGTTCSRIHTASADSFRRWSATSSITCTTSGSGASISQPLIPRKVYMTANATRLLPSP